MRYLALVAFVALLASCGEEQVGIVDSPSGNGSITDDTSNGDGTGSENSGDTSYAVLTSVYTHHEPLADSSASPKQSVVSYLDSEGLLHVAWIEQSIASGQIVKYGQLSSDNELQEYSISHDSFDLIWSVAMVVDDNGSAHLVFQGKRDSSVSCCNSGNYAIYYASNESGSFSSQQISSNPSDPQSNVGGLYDAYVNGRPEIYLNESGSVSILYVADSNKENSYTNYAIVATKTGSSWSMVQAFSAESSDLADANGNNQYAHDRGLHTSRNATDIGPYVWMDISDYDVQVVQSNVNTELHGYGGYLDITNVHAVEDADGTTYAVWLRDMTDDVLGDDLAFYISEITTNGPQTPTRIPIEQSSVTGSFAPVAIDPVTGYFYLLYNKGSFGVVSSSHLIIYDPALEEFTELTLPDSLSGVPYGPDSLWVLDSHLSYATVDSVNSDKFFSIHKWDIPQTSLPW